MHQGPHRKPGISCKRWACNSTDAPVKGQVHWQCGGTTSAVKENPHQTALWPCHSSWESSCGLQKSNFWLWWEQKKGPCADKAWILSCSSPPPAHKLSLLGSAVVQCSAGTRRLSAMQGGWAEKPHGPEFCHILQSSFTCNNTDTVNSPVFRYRTQHR